MSPDWQGTFNDLNNVLKIVNDVNWNINFREKGSEWELFNDNQLIGTFDNRNEMESFIVGMALGLGSLPPEIVDQIKKYIG
ncbi:MAG: hypothetical protein ABI904_04190 [Chloroflexota bacterium]